MQCTIYRLSEWDLQSPDLPNIASTTGFRRNADADFEQPQWTYGPARLGDAPRRAAKSCGSYDSSWPASEYPRDCQLGKCRRGYRYHLRANRLRGLPTHQLEPERHHGCRSWNRLFGARYSVRTQGGERS